MSHFVRLALAALAVPMALLAHAGGPQIDIAYDFVDAFQPALATNAMQATAAPEERSGNIALPGLFVHPTGADDAVVTFDNVAIPDTPDPVFLLVRIGMRDGIPWEEGSANGVRFAIHIDGETVLDEVRTVSRWGARAIDLTPWKGKTVPIAFHTNAIDGNSAYDWSAWGDPIVVAIRNPDAAPPDDLHDNGILLLQLEAAQAVEVTVAVGEKITARSLEPGKHWFPVHFKHYEEPAIQLGGGAVAEQQRIVAFYAPELELIALEPSSPLAYINEPFSIVATIRNNGRGTFEKQPLYLHDLADEASLTPFGEPAFAPLELDEPLPPGELRTVAWDGIKTDAEGVYPVHDIATVTVVPRQPVPPEQRPLSPEITLLENGTAIAANPWSRLMFVRGSVPGTEYWIAETSNGYDWQRMGILCPWVQVVLVGGETLRFQIRQVGESEGMLYVEADASDSAGRPWQLRCEARPAAEAARIFMSYQLTAPEGTEIRAFYGPHIAAGDMELGLDKQFAIFPGLEYLEDEEPSSSTRDLAYPLSDRRVPAMYKIATPLMAYQARWGLIALVWDPHQHWASEEPYPAARFNVPASGSGYGASTMALFAPSVGNYVPENNYAAATPYVVKPGGETLRLDAWLVLDHAANYAPDSVVRGGHGGGLALQAMQHYFEVFGMPEPSEPPRDWETEKTLCRDGYLDAVWHPEYPGWSHCVDWAPGDFIGHTIPLTLDLRDGAPPEAAAANLGRIEAVLDHAIQTRGPEYLWSGAGCHIMLGEVPFYYGFLGEAMTAFRDHGLRLLENRQSDLWRWEPADDKQSVLGEAGDHTLGQAALPSYQALRAARFTGDETLSEQAMGAMKQMEAYNVPRGAQTWECPLYQPDILAAAQAIRAYTEAYRLTGDTAHLTHARYWAWSGLPFLYTWELPDYPTMRYNVISVMGSTFYTHSWIGLPVVWCGLVYAYALQDLAEFDDSFDWKTVAESITHSAMRQQYTEGSSRGAYPDSWNMVDNEPRPADINPENIWVNAFRLRGLSPEIRFLRLDGGAVVNTSADIREHTGSAGTGTVTLSLSGPPDTVAYSLMAPVPPPAFANLPEVADGAALREAPEGWHYHEPLKAIVFKTQHTANPVPVQFDWTEAPK